MQDRRTMDFIRHMRRPDKGNCLESEYVGGIIGRKAKTLGVFLIFLYFIYAFRSISYAFRSLQIDGGLWGRNDYPWDAYFSEPADESVLGWTPSGAEPSMQDSKVQSKINSMAGKMSIVIPPELEEKMKDDPELAKKVMDNIDGFIAKYYRPEANQGFLITFDENGEINHACIACEGRVTVSSSEFVEARKAREAKHAEYERLAEESALKRKMPAQETDRRFYQSKAVSASAYERNIMEAAGILK